MKREIKIGNKNYGSKKEALGFYKTILNSYNFGDTLNLIDYNHMVDLIEYADSVDSYGECDEQVDENEGIEITHIKIAKVQYKTKCFEVYYSDLTSGYISYILMVNRKGYTDNELLYTACRNVVQPDIIRLKQHYFKVNAKNGSVKCQETGLPSKWEELTVDHRQPNTFSIIVERFKELNGLGDCDIDYTQDQDNLIVFENEDLTSRFRTFHREKAALRIIRKECNSGRAFMGRLKKTAKDLTIMNPQGSFNFEKDTMEDEFTEAMHSELSISPEDEIMFRVFTALKVVDTGCTREEVMEMYNLTKEQIDQHESAYEALKD